MKLMSILGKHWPNRVLEVWDRDIIDSEDTTTLGSFSFEDGMLTVLNSEYETLGRYRMKKAARHAH